MLISRKTLVNIFVICYNIIVKNTTNQRRCIILILKRAMALMLVNVMYACLCFGKKH